MTDSSCNVLIRPVLSSLQISVTDREPDSSIAARWPQVGQTFTRVDDERDDDERVDDERGSANRKHEKTPLLPKIRRQRGRNREEAV